MDFTIKTINVYGAWLLVAFDSQHKILNRLGRFSDKYDDACFTSNEECVENVRKYYPEAEILEIVTVSRWYSQIRDFMQGIRRLGGKSIVRNSPNMGSFEERRLRGSLILEEAVMELILEGLGLKINFGHGREICPGYKYDVSFVQVAPPDPVKFFDGCMDAIVVILGSLIQFGMTDNMGMESVNQNNLAKLCDGCSVNELGKLVKPMTHKPPDLARLLFANLGDIVMHNSMEFEVIGLRRDIVEVKNPRKPWEKLEPGNLSYELKVSKDTTKVVPADECTLVRKTSRG